MKAGACDAAEGLRMDDELTGDGMINLDREGVATVYYWLTMVSEPGPVIAEGSITGSEDVMKKIRFSAAVPGYIRANSIRSQLLSSSPCCQTPGLPLWRIDNNTFANDKVHGLPVDIGPSHFEFERVISGQRLAGLAQQQLAPSLNV
jgi:hypothetical protein